MRPIIVSLFLALIVFQSKPSQAGWEAMPVTHHQLYETYGLFFEQQSSLLNYGGGRAWGAVGGSIAVFGNPEAESHPELVISGTANAAMHYDSNFKIYTETIDARVGFQFQFALNPSLRMYVGYMHNSAHASEGVEDINLLYPPLGEEYLPVRVLYDIDRHFRFGATIKPFIRSYPSLLFFSADQFAEWFPWGALDDPRRMSPYIAAGLDEYGVDSLVWTVHAQIGVYLGNHFGNTFHQTVRPVIGFYSGADPHLKYYQFNQQRLEMLYLGFMADI